MGPRDPDEWVPRPDHEGNHEEGRNEKRSARGEANGGGCRPLLVTWTRYETRRPAITATSQHRNYNSSNNGGSGSGGKQASDRSRPKPISPRSSSPSPPPIRVRSRFVPGGGDLGGQVDSDELNLGDWTGLTGFMEKIYLDLAILMH